MRKIWLAAGAALLAAAGALPAAAQEADDSANETAGDSGFIDHSGKYYLSLFGGYSRFGAIELTSTAFVNNPNQGRVKVEETKQFEDYEQGINGGLSVGYYLDQYLRVEGAYVLRRASRKQSDSDFIEVSPGSSNFETSVTTQSLMANGYRDFGLLANVKLATGLGVGLTRAGFKAQYDSGSRAEYDDAKNGIISWQVMLGPTYELARALDVFVEGRYFATMPFDIKDQSNNVSRTSLTTGDLVAGINVRF